MLLNCVDDIIRGDILRGEKTKSFTIKKVSHAFFANLKTNYSIWSREKDPIIGVEQKIMTAIIYHHVGKVNFCKTPREFPVEKLAG